MRRSFGRPSSFLQRRCRVKAHRAERKLHDRPGAEGADQRPDADRPAKQPARERGEREQRDAHRPDRQPAQTLCQTDQQRVARPAAERRGHIGKLGIGHHEKPRDHDRHASEGRAAGRDHVQTVEEIHGLAHDDRVDEHGDADRLAQEHVDGKDGQRYADRGRAVEDAECFGQSQIQHVPRAGADVGLDREIDAEAVDKKARRREQHVCRDRAARAVFAKILFRAHKDHLLCG